MAEAGLLTRIDLIDNGTVLRADHAAGATTLLIDYGLELEVGTRLIIDGSGYRITAMDVDDDDPDAANSPLESAASTDTLTVTPGLATALPAGTRVAPMVGNRPSRYLEATVKPVGDPDDPPDPAYPAIPYDKRSLWHVGEYDPPLFVWLTDDMSEILDVPGYEPSLTADYQSAPDGARVNISQAVDSAGQTITVLGFYPGTDGWQRGEHRIEYGEAGDVASVAHTSPYPTGVPSARAGIWLESTSLGGGLGQIRLVCNGPLLLDSPMVQFPAGSTTYTLADLATRLGVLDGGRYRAGYRSATPKTSLPASGAWRALPMLGTPAVQVDVTKDSAGVVTIPVAGQWAFTLSADFAANATATVRSQRRLRLEWWTGTDPGVGAATRIGIVEVDAQNGIVRLNLSEEEPLPAGAFVRACAWQDSASAINIDLARLNVRKV